MTRGGSGDTGPTGGRSTDAGATSVPGERPHRNADAATVVVAAALVGCGFGRPPLARTRIAAPSKVTSTVPSRSVRYVRPANSRRCWIVAGAGWPYGLPSPAETTATRGRTASRNGTVLAVPEPWWATFRKSSCGRPRARSSGSTPCSTSPSSRNRWPSTSPRRTIETLLIADPPSAGWSGTRLASGHRTWNRIESSVRRSPVDSRPCAGPPFAKTAAHAL